MKYMLRIKDITGQVHETAPVDEVEIKDHMDSSRAAGDTDLLLTDNVRTARDYLEGMARLMVGDIPNDIPANSINHISLHLGDDNYRYFRSESIIWAEVVEVDA